MTEELKHDSYVKEWCLRYAHGVLVFPDLDREDRENLASSIQKVLAENDNSIPVIELPPAVPGVGEQKAQFIPLSNDHTEEYDACDPREEEE